MFAVNYAAFGLVMILFLVFEPQGLVGIWRRVAELVPALAVQAAAARGDEVVTAPLLTLEKLEVAYHRVVTAVQGVSLDVPQGAIVALLGTNGAGKTTTLRAISGFLGLDDARVTDGAISYRGERIENRPPHRVTARGIVLVPERSKVFENLSVAENLEATVPRAARAPSGAGSSTSVVRVLPDARARCARARRATSPAASARCSRSARRSRAGRSCCWSTSSRSASRRSSCRSSPRGCARSATELGITILLVEQNAQVALDIADYGYVMENGRIVLDGTPERLRGHQDIREFYLGGGEARAAATATSSSTAAAGAGMAEGAVAQGRERSRSRFGGLQVLEDVSFAARRGELLALIGPNGAGKTSVLNCICGIYRPRRGPHRVRRRRDITRARRRTASRARRRAHLPARRALPAHDACSRTCSSRAMRAFDTDLLAESLFLPERARGRRSSTAARSRR